MKTKKHFILGLALAFALVSTLAFALVNVGGKDSSTLLNGKYSYSVFAEEDAGSETTLQQSITATKYMISDDANYMLLVTAFDISKVQDDAQYVIGYSIGVNDETATDYNTTYYYNSISFAEDDVRTVADIFGEGYADTYKMIIYEISGYSLDNAYQYQAFVRKVTPGTNFTHENPNDYAVVENSVGKAYDCASKHVLTVVGLNDEQYKLYISTSVSVDKIKALVSTEYDVSLYTEATFENELTGTFAVEEDKTIYARRAFETISIKQNPTRTKYFTTDDQFDVSGLVLTVEYADETTEDVATGYMVADVTIPDVAGDTTIEVTYAGKTVNVPITVITGVENKFEAERFAVKGGATIQETFLQMHNTPGSGYTFVFSSDIDAVAKFRFNLGGNEKAYNFGKSHIVRMNETEYNVSVEVGAHAESWGDYLILTCNVNAGINTLTITNKGEDTSATTVTAANVDYITVITDATVAESRQYIVAGTSTYSLAGWNEIFPNAIATVDEQDDTKLVITLKDGATTNITAADGVSPLDGMLDFSLWRGVTIGGNGTLNVTYSNAQDGINAFNFTVEEGATVNLTGNSASNEKSAVKVYENLTINGTFNVSNFQYGQAITKDQPTKIVTTVGANGHYSITGVQNGIYAWSSTQQNPEINVVGRLSVNASNNAIYLDKASDVYFTGTSQITLVGASGYGIYNSAGSIYVRDSANVSIDSGNSGIYAFKNLVVANGDDLANTTQNSASLTVMANANVIQSASTNSSFIFNTNGTVLVKAKVTGKTGIQISAKSSTRLVIKCADMTIEGADNAIGAWVKITNASTYSTYDYTSEGCAKLKVKNCKAIHNTGNNNATAFGAFTSSTVEVISE